VVSAVGHEPDNPLCDLVADLRAATPTDAAKRVVPDAVAEQRLVAELRLRSARALRNWVHREEHHITQLRSRPVLADPLRAIDDRGHEINRARAALRRDVTRFLAAETDRVGHLSARLSTLGPAATLARGYAVVQAGSLVLRSVADAPPGTQLRIRVADGAVTATSEGVCDE
jgi:exodeoxyribonuclease VII large subunit